jgi:sulfur carrier protein
VIAVEVNGARRELPEGATVAALVEDLHVPGGRGVAVAVDAEVVPKSQWDARRLSGGERVEVLTAIQGG